MTTTPRQGARVIVSDGAGRILLFEGIDPAVPDVTFWFTPGGGLEDGETYEAAAVRELYEETGLRAIDLGEALREDTVEFGFKGTWYRQAQRYFAVRVEGALPDITPDEWTEDEVVAMRRHHWWTLEELEATSDTIYPLDLTKVVRSVEHWGTASRTSPQAP